jgi:hypothetical protein
MITPWVLNHEAYNHTLPLPGEVFTSYFLRLIQRDSSMLLLQSGLTTVMLSCLVYPRKPLQNIQNAAAWVLTETRRRAHITPVLKSLHWLPMSCRIHFKILLLDFKLIHDCAPQCKSDILLSYVPNRSLTYSGTGLLAIPKPRTKRHGEASFFSYYASGLACQKTCGGWSCGHI